MRAVWVELPPCPRCGATSIPDDDGLWDARRQPRWLRGVQFLRAYPEFNKTELQCMECGCTFSKKGLPQNWEALEAKASKPVPEEIEQAIDSRLQPDDDPPIPEEMLGEMPEMPADLGEVPPRRSIKEEMALLNEAHPEVIEKALPWQEQLKRLLDRRPDLVKE